MLYTKDFSYGKGSFLHQKETNGKVFLVYSSSESNAQTLREIWTTDAEGATRAFTDFTTALAACTSGRGDKILVSAGYTTAPTLTELESAASKGVIIEQLGNMLPDGTYLAQRSASNLPQSGNSNLFTVTGPIRLVDFQAEVTQTVQTQANSVTLAAIPTVGSSVNLCTALNITAAATGTTLNITGTLATAMQSNANGVLVSQAAPVTVPAGYLNLHASASNTGKIKCLVRYFPLAPGARVFPTTVS